MSRETAFPAFELMEENDGSARNRLFAFFDRRDQMQADGKHSWIERPQLPRYASADFTIHPVLEIANDHHVELVVREILGDSVSWDERQAILVHLLRGRQEVVVDGLLRKMFADVSHDRKHTVKFFRNESGRLVEPKGSVMVSTKKIESRAYELTRSSEDLFHFFTELQIMDSVPDNVSKLMSRRFFSRGSGGLYKAAADILTAYHDNSHSGHEAARVLNGLGWLVYYRRDAMKQIAEYTDDFRFLSIDTNPWISTFEPSQLDAAQTVYENLRREYYASGSAFQPLLPLDIHELYTAIWPEINRIVPINFGTPAPVNLQEVVRFPHTASVTLKWY